MNPTVIKNIKNSHNLRYELNSSNYTFYAIVGVHDSLHKLKMYNIGDNTVTKLINRDLANRYFTW